MNARQRCRVAMAITFSMISVYGASAEQSSAHDPLPPPGPSERRLHVIEWTPSVVPSSDCTSFFVGNLAIINGTVNRRTGEFSIQRHRHGWSEYSGRYWESAERCIEAKDLQEHRAANIKLRDTLVNLATSHPNGRDFISTYHYESVYSRSQTYHRGELYTRNEVNKIVERALDEQRAKFEARLQQVMGFFDRDLTMLRDELEARLAQR